MTTYTTIDEAIAGSMERNEIAHLYVADRDAVIAAMEALYEAADAADLECDGADQKTLAEVWAVDPATDEQVWRVHVEIDDAR